MYLSARLTVSIKCDDVVVSKTLSYLAVVVPVSVTVNDVNSEIERLEHSISSMRNQIEKYKGQVTRCAVLIPVVVFCSTLRWRVV
jgi:signal transduction protein with GAF and PtsI domain